MPEEEFEVVWNGGPLLPPRDSNPDPTWTAPKTRNRSKYPIKPNSQPEAGVSPKEIENVGSKNR